MKRIEEKKIEIRKILHNIKDIRSETEDLEDRDSMIEYELGKLEKVILSYHDTIYKRLHHFSSMASLLAERLNGFTIDIKELNDENTES